MVEHFLSQEIKNKENKTIYTKNGLKPLKQNTEQKSRLKSHVFATVEDSFIVIHELTSIFFFCYKLISDIKNLLFIGKLKSGL